MEVERKEEEPESVECVSYPISAYSGRPEDGRQMIYQ